MYIQCFFLLTIACFYFLLSIVPICYVNFRSDSDIHQSEIKQGFMISGNVMVALLPSFSFNRHKLINIPVSRIKQDDNSVILSQNQTSSDIKHPKYIWDNSDKYETLCKRILSLNENGPVLTYSFSQGGFGNRLYAAVAVSAAAIVSNHAYYIGLRYPVYRDLFDGCYNNQFLDDMSVFKYNQVCSPYDKCFSRNSEYWDVEKIVGNKNVRIAGYLMEPLKIIKNPKYKKVWNNLFEGIDTPLTDWKIRKWLIRLIMNPSQKLQNAIRIEKQKILQFPYTIGLQLRMGGKYADTPEPYEGVPFTRIPEVVDRINTIISNNKWNGKVQLYMSSDSSMVIEYVRNLTRNQYPVVESTLFNRGHTDKNTDRIEEITSKVITDFYYMSICNHVIVTWPSSFGRLMCFMSDAACEPVLNWKVENKGKPFPK